MVYGVLIPQGTPVPNLLQFRQAVARHLGAELTPEVAADIEAEAWTVRDESIDPARFVRMTHKGYSFHVERFVEVLSELHPMHVAHWAETEKARHGLKLNPDYASLVLRERAGRLIQFTVRRDGELCGGLRMYLGLSTHTQTLQADEDALYVAPAHRGGFMVIAFMRYAEAALRSLGVVEINCNSKLINRADVLMRRLGYTAVATQFNKIFKENV